MNEAYISIRKDMAALIQLTTNNK
jgi:hypothetical protein